MRRPHWNLPGSLRRTCLALLLTLLTLWPGRTADAQTPTPTSPADPIPQTVAELQTRIQAVLDETQVPGVGIALVTPDGQLSAFGLGLADVAARTPVTVDTRFRIGSASKTLVALAVLKLQEEGKLDLDAVVTELAPEIRFANPWADAAPVRLVHLLEHTAGLDDMQPREYAADDPAITTLEGLQLYGRPRPVRWPPGRYMSYSNPGPVIAAYLVEKASGQRFEDYVQAAIFAPLDMTGAGYFLTPEVEALLAKSYRADGVTPVPYSHIVLRPSGAASMTPRDLGRLVQLLLGRGTLNGVQILTPASVARMETTETTLAAAAGVEAGYGLGNYVTPEKGFVWHGHNGAIDGYLTDYGYLPNRQMGYGFTINQAHGAAYDQIGRLIRGYLTRELGAPALPAVPEVDLTPVSGYYTPITPRQEFLRFLQRLIGTVYTGPVSDGLLLRALLGGTPATLVPVTPTLYRQAQDPIPSVAFVEVDGAQVLTGAPGSFRRIAAWDAWLRLAALAGTALTLVSSLLLVLIWLPLALWRRQRSGQVWALYLLPVLAVTCLPLLLALLVGAPDPLRTLGSLNGRSVAVWLLAWLFVLLGVAAFVQVVRLWRRPPGRAGWVHAALVSLGCLLTAGYLLAADIIGRPPWLW